MGDAEKKPRTKMNLEELLEETNKTVDKVWAMMEDGGLNQQSLDQVKQLAAQLQWPRCLNLAQDLGLSMPYIDHLELLLLLKDAWDTVVIMKANARKVCYRKCRMLEADNKTEEEVLRKWTTERTKTDNEAAKCKLRLIEVTQVVELMQEGSGAGVGKALLSSAMDGSTEPVGDSLAPKAAA